MPGNKGQEVKEKNIDENVVKHVASLARLEILDKDIATYQKHMQKFLNHVADISKAATDDIEPFFSPAKENMDLYSKSALLRPDQIKEPLPTIELLKNAPKKTSNQFRVDAVIEDA